MITPTAAITAATIPPTPLIGLTPTAQTALDPERILARIPLTWKPTLVASGYGFIWIVSREDHTVARLDPNTHQFVGAPVRLPEPIYDIVVGEGGVWVTGDTTVTRLDPVTGKITATLRADQFGDGGPFRLAVGDGSIWLVNLIQAAWGSHVHRIDPHTNRFVGKPATVGVEAVGIAFGADSVWTANHDDSTVSRIDPKTNTAVATITLSSEPHYIYFNSDDGLVWVANYHDDSVSRIDPRTNQLVGKPLRVPFAPEWMTSGNGKVWVLPSPTIEEHLQGVESIAEFDSTTAGEAKNVPLGGLPMDAALGDGALWITLQSPDMLLKLAP